MREKITIYSCLLILTFTDIGLKNKAFLGLITCPWIILSKPIYKIVVYQILEKHAIKQSSDQEYQTVGYQIVGYQKL